MMAFKLELVLLVAGICSASRLPHRIMGGEPTTIEQHPSIVQVDFYNSWGGNWFQSCAGTIINSRYVISAAHCYIGYNADSVWRRIRAGATYRNTGGQIVGLAKATNHPEYGKIQYENDISILLLEETLVFSSTVQAVPIVSQNFEIPDNTAVVQAGWGLTEVVDGSSSDQLHEVTTFTINNDLCRERYLTLPYPLIVTDSMICSGILDVGGKDACNGDSGGPMYFQNILVGIVSWSHGCANETYPGVSTRIASYTNWILETAV